MMKTLRGKTMPVTWAAVLAGIPVCVAIVPAFLWAGSITARVSEAEKYREAHKLESVHRREFDKLEDAAVKIPEFKQFSSRVLDALQRIEGKLDRR
jgi:hypothetical protein